MYGSAPTAVPKKRFFRQFGSESGAVRCVLCAALCRRSPKVRCRSKVKRCRYAFKYLWSVRGCTQYLYWRRRFLFFLFLKTKATTHTALRKSIVILNVKTAETQPQCEFLRGSAFSARPQPQEKKPQCVLSLRIPILKLITNKLEWYVNKYLKK